MARLLFVNPSGRLGGPAHSLLLLLKYLRLKHEVTVLVPEEGEFSLVLQQEDIPYHVQPLRLRYTPALAWWILREKFDLVYGNYFHYRTYVALFAAKAIRKPRIWHFREILPTNIDPSHIRHTDSMEAIIAVSEAAARAIHYHLPDKEINIVYNGVEVEHFTVSRDEARSRVQQTLGIGNDRVVVLNVGHICPRKNQMQAIQAASLVVQQHPAVVFGFLGRLDHTPEYTTALGHQIAQLGIEDNVRLLGFHNDLATYLRGADILLHMSVKDPHPRAVIEGMAAALPVVAYAVDGVSETVVSGQTGTLVPPGDVAGVAQAIGELIETPSLQLRMGKRGCQHVESLFSAEHTARQIDSVIQRVLGSEAVSLGLSKGTVP